MKQLRKKNQKGSALLLTLGILSLVLVLGMSFAFTARTNLQVSQVNADQVKARLLAESCLERVLANLTYAMRQTPDNLNGNDYYLSTRNSDKAGFNTQPSTEKVIKNTTTNYKQHIATIGSDTSNESQYSLVQTILDNSKVAKNLINKAATTGSNLESLPSTTGFQTIIAKENVDGDATVRAKGRMGFIMLDETGKLDINRLIPLRKSNNLPFVHYDATNSVQMDRDNGQLNLNFNATTDFYYPILADSDNKISYDPTGDITAQNTIRLGIHPMEISTDAKYISNLYDGYSGLTRTQWFSYNHLMNTLSDFKNDYFKYTFFSQQEPEQYRLGLAGSAHRHNRFDLTGYEQGERSESTGGIASQLSFYDSNNKPSSQNKSCYWNTKDSNYDTWKTNARDLINDLCTTPSADDNDLSTIQKNIPWLTKIKGESTPGSGTLDTDLSKHVAANMLDFCDEDSVATIDPNFNFEVLNPDAPEYCGNEKVPYINEIYLVFNIEITKISASNEFEFKVTYYNPQIEFINMFNEDLDTGAKTRLRLVGSIEAKCTNSAHTTTPHKWTPVLSEVSELSTSQSITKESLVKAELTPTQTTLLTFREPGILVTDASGTDYKNPAIDFTFTIEKIVVLMEDDDKIQDVAYIAPTTSLTRTITTEQRTTDKDLHYCVSTQCMDARVNHRNASWFFVKDTGGKQILEITEKTDITNATLENTNASSLFPSSYSCDDEENYDKPSTAYIKNAPFENFWELGCISRGEPRRTINLNAYTSYNTTTGSYAEGDAGILDQIKIGPAKYAYKINLLGQYNLSDTLLKKSLLANIDYENSTYETPKVSSSDFPGTITIPTTFSNDASRGQLANFITPPTGATTDSEKESFIGRSANLFSTRYEYFTLFVVGQPLEQLDEITDSNFSDVSSFLVNPTKYTYFYRSTDGGTRSSQTKYCSIRATQVMEVYLMRDAWTNKITILHKHYVE